jgi:hypothetical protein
MTLLIIAAQEHGKTAANSGYLAVLSIAAAPKLQDFCGESVNGR